MMFTGKMVKGIFGRLTEQVGKDVSDFSRGPFFSDICSHVGEQHEYDPVNGWVIRMDKVKNGKRCNHGSFSQVQTNIVIGSTDKVCQTGRADYSEFLPEVQTERV
jgi:hypothetical protein